MNNNTFSFKPVSYSPLQKQIIQKKPTYSTTNKRKRAIYNSLAISSDNRKNIF